MYQRILLTNDGSELAAAAIPHASTIAKATGAEVVVLQVVDSVAQIMTQMTTGTIEPLPAGPVTAEIAEESVGSQHAEAEKGLNAVKARLETDGVQNVRILVAEGRPQDAIVDVARELGCDLIVMATHGRSGLGRAILGSVADHVVRNASNAAVLLTRPDMDDKDD
jgi:nucleotide-binding universal stress UspA family protein